MNIDSFLELEFMKYVDLLSLFDLPPEGGRGAVNGVSCVAHSEAAVLFFPVKSPAGAELSASSIKISVSPEGEAVPSLPSLLSAEYGEAVTVEQFLDVFGVTSHSSRPGRPRP